MKDVVAIPFLSMTNVTDNKDIKIFGENVERIKLYKDEDLKLTSSKSASSLRRFGKFEFWSNKFISESSPLAEFISFI